MFPSFLRSLDSREEAPPDTYILYNLKGGIYCMNRNDFPNFMLEWISTPNPPPLTLDLTSTQTHSIILNYDYYPNHTNKPIGNTIFEFIETNLKMILLPKVPHFTYILAIRPQHMGIHVYLPEFKIANDDYILLCQILQYKLQENLRGNGIYKLDIPMNAMLPGAAKPNTRPYFPVRVTYVDERVTHKLNIMKFNEEYETVKKSFPARKNNANALFRSLLKVNDRQMFMDQLRQLMMPVICSRTDAPTHSLSFAGSIVRHPPDDAQNLQVCATFRCKQSTDLNYICKSPQPVFDNPSLLRIYQHLKLNASNMIDFETSNYAMKRWFEQFSASASGVNDSHIPPFFRDVHEMLQFEHMTLARNPNPIKTIMQYNEGYYFLPVFYSLCTHYQKDSVAMSQELRSLLDYEFHPLLDKISSVNPKNFQYALADVSINTLHFCANNLYREQPKSNRDKLKWIVEDNQRAILSVTTVEQLTELLRNMQERHLPIRVLKLKNALKKPSRFVWNALIESWQEVNTSSEIADHIQNLWSYVKAFYIQHVNSGGRGLPDEDVIYRFSVTALVASINSDTAMERKDIQMDTHKWFLRLQDGVLDLLTGHIGGVVPEFFLSDRKINLGIPRKRMTVLCNRSPLLEELYVLLTDQKFFLKYMQALFLDRRETLMDALVDSIKPELLADGELSMSMLHFYVNLCKCTSFEYQLLMYMLDVLASVFVGTNYERKFFVWKGLTRNGKSKLFELMGRVLGGYYHSIQSENLTPSHSSNNATPELASTLFSCRMVTTEELEKRLDENRVKQITGNSFVTFRNMYEQNSGGIPTAKIFATTNNYPECKASEAFKDRVVAIPFDAEFVDNAPERTSTQLEKNVFRKEAYVVEQSYRGCFLVLYYHLKRNINLDDGLLHYRTEPSCVKEYTDDYLAHADIYVQFKLHMDVQLKSGFQTTLNEVRSAIRQYLTTTKNTSFHESELLFCFEKEFGHLRQTDVKVWSENEDAFGYTSILDEEPDEQPQVKKFKSDNSFVFYDGVIIKNLKKHVDD